MKVIWNQLKFSRINYIFFSDLRVIISKQTFPLNVFRTVGSTRQTGPNVSKVSHVYNPALF